MGSNQPSVAGEPPIFQSEYGRFRRGFLWMLLLPATIGVIGVPVGIFFNEGWEMNGHPLEPWSATVIIEIFSVGALAAVVSAVVTTWMRRKSPQRVVLTKATIIVPKGIYSSAELELPLSEVKLAEFSMGFVKQLQIKHGRRKVLLSSALFPANQDFDRLIACLGM